MSKSGRVVVLNGAPRSGKTSLARALQAEGSWIHWGVDAFNATLPPAFLPGIGLRPGGERPDLEPLVRQLYAQYFRVLRDFAEAGFDVVADLGLHRDYADPFDPCAMLREQLAHLPLLMVGVESDLATIMARRNADLQNGLYLGGPGVPAPVARWQEAVHEGQRYDLRLDMGVLSPAAGAHAILAALAAAAID